MKPPLVSWFRHSFAALLFVARAWCPRGLSARAWCPRGLSARAWCPRWSLPLAVVAALGLVGMPNAARATSKHLEIPNESEAEDSPAYRYANMTNREAYEELDRRPRTIASADS